MAIQHKTSLVTILSYKFYNTERRSSKIVTKKILSPSHSRNNPRHSLQKKVATRQQREGARSGSEQQKTFTVVDFATGLFG